MGGGAVAFLAYEPNLLRTIFFILDFAIFLVFSNVYLIKRVKVTKLLDKE